MRVNIRISYDLISRNPDSVEEYACKKIEEFFTRLIQESLEHTDTEIVVSYNSNTYMFVVDIIINDADHLVAWEIKKHINADILSIRDYGDLRCHGRRLYYQ